MKFFCGSSTSDKVPVGTVGPFVQAARPLRPKMAKARLVALAFLATLQMNLPSEGNALDGVNFGALRAALDNMDRSLEACLMEHYAGRFGEGCVLYFSEIEKYFPMISTLSDSLTAMSDNGTVLTPEDEREMQDISRQLQHQMQGLRLLTN